jgi:hypothetical protein
MSDDLATSSYPDAESRAHVPDPVVQFVEHPVQEFSVYALHELGAHMLEQK